MINTNELLKAYLAMVEHGVVNVIVDDLSNVAEVRKHLLSLGLTFYHYESAAGNSTLFFYPDRSMYVSTRAVGNESLTYYVGDRSRADEEDDVNAEDGWHPVSFSDGDWNAVFSLLGLRLGEAIYNREVVGVTSPSAQILDTIVAEYNDVMIDILSTHGKQWLEEIASEFIQDEGLS